MNHSLTDLLLEDRLCLFPAARAGGAEFDAGYTPRATYFLTASIARPISACRL